METKIEYFQTYHEYYVSLGFKHLANKKIIDHGKDDKLGYYIKFKK